jgi:hypothetical protein
VPHQGELDRVTAPHRFVLGKFENDLLREVFALKQAEQVALQQTGIARERQQNILGGFLEEALNLGA